MRCQKCFFHIENEKCNLTLEEKKALKAFYNIADKRKDFPNAESLLDRCKEAHEKYMVWEDANDKAAWERKREQKAEDFRQMTFDDQDFKAYVDLFTRKDHYKNQVKDLASKLEYKSNDLNIAQTQLSHVPEELNTSDNENHFLRKMIRSYESDAG